MDNYQDNNEYEIIDSGDGKLSKVFRDGKSAISKFVDKFVEVPNFAKEILKSSDSSEKSFDQFAKQDKDMVEKIINEKLQSGDYTDEELLKWYKEMKEITKEKKEVVNKGNEYKKELLFVVATSMVLVLKTMLENKNKI